MTNFVAAGKTWKLAITIGAVKRIKQDLGVDLLALQEGDPPLIQRLNTDLALLVDVIYSAVRPQAEAENVTDTQFGEAFGGEESYAAYQAFMEALADFFRLLHRPDLQRLVTTCEELVESEAVKQEQALGEVFQAAGRMADRHRAEALASLSGGSGISSTVSPALLD